MVPKSFPSVSAPFATSAVGALYAIKYEGTFIELSPSPWPQSKKSIRKKLTNDERKGLFLAIIRLLH